MEKDRTGSRCPWSGCPPTSQLRGIICCGAECGTEGPRRVVQELGMHTLNVGPVIFHLHEVLWARCRSKIEGGCVTPDGIRGTLMANLGSCFPSEMDRVES